MEIKVGSYFYNSAKDAHDEFHITLTEADGLEMFPDKWGGWKFPERYKKLRGMGDYLTLKWALSRGYRVAESAQEDLQRIITEDLS